MGKYAIGSKNPEVFFRDDDGTEYKTIRNLASALKITLTKLRETINEEGSISEAVKKIKEEKREALEPRYKFKGKGYSTQRELAEAMGVSRQTLNQLLKTYNGDIGKVYSYIQKIKRQANSYVYKGVEYPNLMALATEYSVLKRELEDYLEKYEYNVDEALDKLLEDKRIQEEEGIRQREEAKRQKAERKAEVQKKMIEERQKRKEDKAKKKNKTSTTRLSGPYTFQGKEYKNIKELAEVLGVSTDITRALLREMKTIESVYEHIQENQEKYFGYEYKGKKYSNYIALADAYSVSRHAFRYYLKKYNNNIEIAMDKAIEAKKTQQVREIYNKLVGIVNINKRLLKELIMRSLETGEDLQELINQNQKQNKVFIYKGKIFKSKLSLSRELGIAIPTLNRYLEKFGDNIEEIANKLNGYLYDGEFFETVEQLSEYTGIDVNRLDVYLGKCEKNVEKAIFILKMNDMKNEKINIQLPGKGKVEIDTADLSILLGMKQRELIFAMFRQISIGELKEKEYSQPDGKNIAYSEKIELLKYCIQNNLDFKYCYVAMETYDRSFEEVTKMKKSSKLIPESYIVKKYGALLRVLDEREEIDHTEIISELRASKLSIEELIERCILKEKCEDEQLDFIIMRNIYNFLSSEIVDDEEKSALLSQISPTKKESECVSFVQDKMKRIKRLIQLNEVAQILKSDCSEEEKNQCIKDNAVTSEEVEDIILDLYDEYDFRRNRNQSEEEKSNRKAKRTTAIRWTYMTEQERSRLSGFFSDDDIKEIESKSNLLEHYKRLIQSFNRDEAEQSNGEKPSN